MHYCCFVLSDERLTEKKISKIMDERQSDIYWDWYVVGGRWGGLLETDYRDSDITKISEVMNFEEVCPYMVIVDGGTYDMRCCGVREEEGEFAWWEEPAEDWENRVKEYISEHKNGYIAVVDYHA